MRNIKRNFGEHEDYSPIALARYHTEEELQAEYKRMRENLRKNIGRIRKSGEFEDAQILKTYSEFETPRNYTKEQLARKLSRLEGLLSANTATLTGLREQRREVIETLQDRGYKAINKENFADFTRFMDSTRALALSVLRYKYSSFGTAQGEDRNKRLELFNAAQRKGITTNALISDFTFFVKHVDEIKQLPDRPHGRKMGARTVRKLIK